MPYKVNSGDLIDQLAIQHKVETQSSTGAMTNSWQAFATVWGRMNLQKGREQNAANQTQAIIQGEATIRYREDITANMRVVFKSKNYDILAITPDDRFADHLILTLAQGANEG